MKYILNPYMDKVRSQRREFVKVNAVILVVLTVALFLALNSAW